MTELRRTRDHMRSRGPDDFGELITAKGRLGLGHRRLAIIDPSEAGAQPMHDASGRYAIVFNGEIYNYPNLREELMQRGVVFRGHSDTEVLVHLYALKGPRAVNDLRGMFAFAIWDELEQRLFLARDPHGIKPLYYADDGLTFRFASQVKALIAGGAVRNTIEPAGLVGFYLLGSVPEPWTIHGDIRALPAGCTLTVDTRGAGQPSRYHSVSETYCEAEQAGQNHRADAGDIRRIVRDTLLDSVRSHLVSDVPVGAFLSAGIDSGTIVGLMKDAGAKDARTVTVAFAELAGSREDESPTAAAVARLYGTDHTTRLVTRDEFEADLPLILEAMDQPSIDGINSWFASKAASELGLKVVLSGLGGDELFGGYPSFRDIPRWVSRLGPLSSVPLLGRMMRAAGPGAIALGFNPKIAGLVDLGGTYPGAYLLKRGLYLPSELGQVLDAATIRAGLERLDPADHIARELARGPSLPFNKVAALETTLYMRNQLLRDTDWASMAHSLEVRVPLVDRVVLETLAPFAARCGKAMIAHSPSTPLPTEIVDRPKTGFTVPVGRWIGDSVRGGRPGEPWARSWARMVGTRAPHLVPKVAGEAPLLEAVG